MAEQLIYLEAADDITEATRRLRRASQSAVTMVIPRRALLLQSVVNLKILARQAEMLGKEISIVTQDEIGRAFAAQAGLKVMDQLSSGQPSKASQAVTLVETAPAIDEEISAEPADTQPRAMLSRSRRPMSHRSRRVATLRWPRLTLRQLKWERHHRITLGFVAIGLIVLGSVAVFVAPKAYVALEVQSEPFQKQFTLVLADVRDRQAVGSNVLTGRFIEVSRESVSEFEATGEENSGQKASGKITVLNYTTSIQGLLTNTRFQTVSGLVFRINTEVLVPPVRSGTPGRAAVEATADTGGTKYNIASGARLTVPGLGEAGASAVVGEAAAFTGGTDEITKVVSEEDIQQGKEASAKDVFTAAATELRAKLKVNEELVDDLIQDDIIDATPSAVAGAKRDKFEIRVRSRSWAIAIRQGELRTAIAAAAAFEVPEGKQATARTVDQAGVAVVESNFLNHRVDLLVKLGGLIGPRLDTTELALRLANQPLIAAEKALQGMTEITSGSIELWPTFLTRTPVLANNIRVQIIYLGE